MNSLIRRQDQCAKVAKGEAHLVFKVILHFHFRDKRVIYLPMIETDKINKSVDACMTDSEAQGPQDPLMA